MAPRRPIGLQPSAPAGIGPRLERQLWQLFERHWPDEGPPDVDGLVAAVVSFAFDHELVVLPPPGPERDAGAAEYLTTRQGDSRRVYLARVEPARPAPTDFERL